MKERTLILLKPDAVQRSLLGNIIERFERVGLKIVGLKMVRAEKESIRNHYTVDPNWIKNKGAGIRKIFGSDAKEVRDKTDEELGENILDSLTRYISSSPVVVCCIEGPHAIALVRKLVGKTEPLTSDVGTIRGDFVIDSYEHADKRNRAVRNLIHASSGQDEARREVEIWFSNEELMKYKNINDYIGDHSEFE